jgi:ABC-type lipoprotein release transport system permease subunit
VPLSLLLSLSWRNLLRNGRRTLMLSLAVAVGVTSLVLMAALLRGWLASTVDEALDGLTGHLRVHETAWLDDPGADASFPLPAAWTASLDSDADVLTWTARLRVPAVVMSERETRGAMIVGVDAARERGLSFLGDARIEGRGLAGLEDGGLLLGAALAEELETGLGKRVVLMTQGADGATVERGYRIVGVYDVQGEALEKAFLFTGRAALARTLRLRDEYVTEVSLRLLPERAEDIDAIAARIEAAARAAVDGDLAVRTWRDLIPQAAAMVEVSDTSIWVWYLILMSALGFGLVNTLLTSVMERVRELGLLQAVGMRPTGVLWQVLLESWLILTVGLAAGLLGGLLAIWWLEDGIDLGAWSEGLEMFGISRVLVPQLFVSDLLEIGAVVLGLGLLGSIYPARKAVAIDPLKALNRQQE